MKRYKKGVLLFVGILIVNLSLVGLAQATGSETPSVSDYQNAIIGVNDSFLVQGTVVASSEVLVYIDGSFIDYTDTRQGSDGRLIHEYRLNKVLTDGEHKFMIIGRDRTSLVLSPPTKEYNFNFQNRPKPAAPTIIYPRNESRVGSRQSLITGLTQSGTIIKIYLDNEPIFKSEVLTNDSGTANFAYRLKEELNLGDHVLSVSAENGYGQISLVKTIVFIAENPLPAPVLIKAAPYNKNKVNNVLISGLVKNDLGVKVFIDNKLDGSLSVINHKSGVANFAYSPKKTLTNGSHLVYATSIDKTGKESFKSNGVTVNISSGRVSQAKEPVKSELEKSMAQEKAVPAGLEQKTEKEEPKQTAPIEKKELPELVKRASPTPEVSTGAIDESKQGQNKVKLNLVIFIIFLLAVIGWIFWVNRELIKEKKAQDKEISGSQIEPNKKP